MPTNVFLVEDHPLMRETLSSFLQHYPDLTVCGVAESGEEALRILTNGEGHEEHIDVILIDVSLPNMSGIDLVRALADHASGFTCLMLSGHQEANYVTRALDAGARGYVLKGNPYELFDAIQQAARGGIYLSKPLR